LILVCLTPGVKQLFKQLPDTEYYFPESTHRLMHALVKFLISANIANRFNT